MEHAQKKTLLFERKKTFIFDNCNFPKELLQKAQNKLVYGALTQKWAKKKKSFHGVLVYLLEDDPCYLQWLSSKKSYPQSRLDLRLLISVYSEPLFIPKKKQNLYYLCLTYGENQFICFSFNLKNERDLFWQAIQYFYELAMKPEAETQEQISRKLFLSFDKDGTKFLDRKEIKELLTELHIGVSTEFFNKIWNEFDKNQNGELDYEEFAAFMNRLLFKKELIPYFQRFCKNAEEGLKEHEEEVMTLEELGRFFKIVQQENNSKEELLRIVTFFQNKLQNDEPKAISFLTFCNIIFSKNNSIYDLKAECLYQDMNQPLSDYWINSSHNTYLLSNQLTGNSSTLAYVNAFQKGCRCVELDCWDGDKGEPIIYHGHTLTSKILFEDVIKVVKEYGFKNSPYPIILSIENHCSQKFQNRMAEILKNILGSSLYTLPSDWEEYNTFPSPNQLLRKVIIKDKGKLVPRNRQHDENFSETMIENVPGNPHNTEVCVFKKTDFKKQLITFDSEEEKPQNSASQPLYKYRYDKTLNEEVIDEEVAEPPKNDKKAKSVPAKGELSKLVVLHGCHLKFDDPLRTIWHISSLGEAKVTKHLSNNEEALIELIKKSFIRTYPGGLRFDSSNYDPVPAFISGAQVIALNFQTNDASLLLYLSRFMENGGIESGYVLKPQFMLSSCSNPKYPKDFIKPKYLLSITIISANQLKHIRAKEKDIIDPFIELSINGIQTDNQQNEVYRTKVVQDNGLNPQFNEKFQFKINCIDLAFLSFQVFDRDNFNDEKLAWFCLPVNRLRNGLRVVPLRNTQDLSYIEHSYLLCEISDQTSEKLMCSSFNFLIQKIVISEADFASPITIFGTPPHNEEIYKKPSKLQRLLFDEDDMDEENEVLRPRKYVTTSEFMLNEETNDFEPNGGLLIKQSKSEDLRADDEGEGLDIFEIFDSKMSLDKTPSLHYKAIKKMDGNNLFTTPKKMKKKASCKSKTKKIQKFFDVCFLDETPRK